MQIKLPPYLFAPYSLASKIIALIDRWLTPLFVLGTRLYVAQIFFHSGWLKASNWDNTLTLFNYIYHVPVLPPHLAAIMGMSGELGLSVLFALGFATRFAAAGLFVVNWISVISFPDLSDIGLQQQILWGFMMLVPLFYGGGKLSVDGLLNFQKARS